jgi:enoyl-CoA hydratase/carnithine racemase
MVAPPPPSVLTGAGAFCAGADLKALAAGFVAGQGRHGAPAVPWIPGSETR